MSAKKATNRAQTAASPKRSLSTQNGFAPSVSRLSSASETRPCETKSSKTGKFNTASASSPVTRQSAVKVTPSGDGYKTWKDASDCKTPHFVGGTPQLKLFQNELSITKSLNAARPESKQEKRIKFLQKENEELKSELLFNKSLYRQLVEELPTENFDERRVNLLKSKLIQLERQVMLQSSALNSRYTMLIEVENMLVKVRDNLRFFLESMEGEECQQRLDYLLTSIESTRLSLFKTIQETDPESLSLPFVFMTPFIKQTKDPQPLTILDICSGRLEHLNLKQVAKLESKLCRLYKQMVCLKEALHLGSERSKFSNIATCEHIGEPIRKRLSNHVTTVTQSLEECCSHLLSLSVLYPNAPWPPLKSAIRPDLTVQNVMEHMPSLAKRKQQEVQSVVEALIKAFNYTKHMLSLEIRILKDEISFHQTVYQLQVDYSNSLLDAVRSAYQEFERNARKMICTPLSVILTRYNELKNTASEDALRNFLSAFKETADQLAEAVECLQAQGDQTVNGACAVSEFGEHFFSSLKTLLREHVTKRDANMKDLLDKRSGAKVKVPREEIDETGHESLDDSSLTQ